jgi:hypothetical protein
MDGLVITASSDTPLIEQLLTNAIPFVMLERPLRAFEQVSYVSVDNVQAARTATETDQSRPAPDRDHRGWVGQFRRPGPAGGLQAGADDANLPLDPALVVEGAFSRRSGYLGMKTLLREKVDAVFAASDTIAVGALQRSRRARCASRIRLRWSVSMICRSPGWQSTPDDYSTAHPAQGLAGHPPAGGYAGRAVKGPKQNPTPNPTGYSSIEWGETF